MQPPTFRVKVPGYRGAYFTVIVHPTLAHMREQCHCRKCSWKTTGLHKARAYLHYHGKTYRTDEWGNTVKHGLRGEIGVFHFVERYLTMRIISHESSHAALSCVMVCCQTLNFHSPRYEDADEVIAGLVGDFSSMIVDKCERLGLLKCHTRS